jgi:hypothetical protein
VLRIEDSIASCALTTPVACFEALFSPGQLMCNDGNFSMSRTTYRLTDRTAGMAAAFSFTPAIDTRLAGARRASQGRQGQRYDRPHPA